MYGLVGKLGRGICASLYSHDMTRVAANLLEKFFAKHHLGIVLIASHRQTRDLLVNYQAVEIIIRKLNLLGILTRE